MKIKSLVILLLIINVLNAQNTLISVIQKGITHSFSSKNIKLDKDIVQYQIDAFNSSIGWQMNFYGQIPAYSKSNLSTVQNDGNIAFQPVHYNNSGVGLALSKTVWQTGGQFEISSGLQRFDNFESKNHIYNGIPIRLTYRQNLLGYNPYKWQRKNNQLEKEISNKKSELDILVLKRKITAAYFDVISAQNERKSNQTNVELTENLIKIAKAKDRLGLISKRQFLQLELQLKTAKSQFNIADINFKTAKLNLETLLSTQKLNGSFEIPVPENINIDEQKILAIVKENRPEWIAFQQKIQEKEQNVKSKSKEYGPYVGFSASIGFIRSDVDLNPIYSDAQRDQSINISFNVPIFDSKLKRNEVKLAKLELEKQINTNAKEQLNLENDIKSIVKQLKACQNRLKYAEEIKNISIENLNINTEVFKLGSISITELNYAIQEKDRAFRNYISEVRLFWMLY